MKFQIAILLLSAVAASVHADLTFTKDESMCNCKAPYNKMYNAYKKAAAETCATYPAGTPGQASCIAAALGYSTNEGRAFNHEAITKDFEGLAFVTGCDPKLPELPASDSFQWHGNFNYFDLDKSLATYFDCIDKAMEVDCNNQLLNKVRTCKSAK